jgi:hypothetical protein
MRISRIRKLEHELPHPLATCTLDSKVYARGWRAANLGIGHSKRRFGAKAMPQQTQV